MQASKDPVPAPKTGFLKKLSRSKSFTTFISNWQKRYFTLIKGKIVYYETVASDGVTPVNQKGDMKLVNSSIQSSNERQIKIIGGHDEYDMLIEAPTVEEYNSWSEALREHIIFATNQNWAEREYLVDLVYLTGKKVDIKQSNSWTKYLITLSDGWISGKPNNASDVLTAEDATEGKSDVDEKPFF